LTSAQIVTHDCVLRGCGTISRRLKRLPPWCRTVLVLRLLWSFVWFPSKKPATTAAAGPTAAGGNGVDGDSDSSSDESDAAGAGKPQRRRRVRRET